MPVPKEEPAPAAPPPAAAPAAEPAPPEPIAVQPAEPERTALADGPRPDGGPAPEPPAAQADAEARDDEVGPAPVVFPVAHPPDDPGPEGEAEKPARRRLFG
jgi:HemY protein